MSNAQLIGVCGIYCGACLLYRAYKDCDQALTDYLTNVGIPKEAIRCEGCTSELISPTCVNCNIRDCAKQKGMAYCYECKELPCKRLTELSIERAKKDNLPHLALCIDNLDTLRQIGTEEWLRKQDKRWACSSCGKKHNWYTEKCSNCGAMFDNAVKESERKSLK